MTQNIGTCRSSPAASDVLVWNMHFLDASACKAAPGLILFSAEFVTGHVTLTKVSRTGQTTTSFHKVRQ